MKKALLIITTISLTTLTSAFAQITDTLGITKDAMIRDFPGELDNFGDYPYTNMHTWTNQGSTVTHRSLLDIDLSYIPVGSNVINAELHLKSDMMSNQFSNGHQPLTGSNSCVINSIVSPWDEDQVIWSNQPNYSTLNEVVMPQSSSNFEDYVVNVTAMIQAKINNPTENNGLMIKLIQESPYRRLVFASSDNPDPTLRPELIITYDLVSSISNNITNQLAFSMYPNPMLDQVMLQFENPVPVLKTINIIDSQGRVIFSINDTFSKLIRIERKVLDSGVYFVQIQQKGLLELTKRLIVS